ncbi:unnamed protein product [Brugia timori]|uniref:Uncharacterized protein n=1 Tax=Brugia timori TaxID=42155 RepID=A0A0R3QDV9_9BILA|nr:unnamed protein product [Brugia timori]
MNDNLDDNKESVDNVVVDVVVVGAGVVVVDVVVVVGAVDDDAGVGDDIAAVELMQVSEVVHEVRLQLNLLLFDSFHYLTYLHILKHLVVHYYPEYDPVQLYNSCKRKRKIIS